MSTIFVESSADARAAFDLFSESDGWLAFDTETTGLNVRSGLQDYGRTIQFSWRPWTDAVVFEMNDRWRPAIAAFIRTASARQGHLIAHNLKFDLHVLTTYAQDDNDFVFTEWFDWDQYHDTVWVARLHDERDRAALKPLAAKYLDLPPDSQTKLKRLMTKHGWNWATVPVAHLVEYGGNDAIITGKLYDLLWPRIEGYATEAYRREQRLAPLLFHMERTGLAVDLEGLDTVIAEETRLVDEARISLEVLAPGMNPGSPVQVKAALADRGHEVEDTQAATLMKLVATVSDDLAASLLKFRKHSKLLTTYARPWKTFVASDGRVHPSLNQMGAATGRFSSEAPNFQNIAKTGGLRNLIVAAPGHRLVVADWNQMELRLYAHFANDERMRAAFLSGEDIYEQAAALLGVSRDVGKMVMLASIYGAGPKTLKRQVVVMAYKFGMEDIVEELEGMDWRALHARFHEAYAIKDLARLTELAARRRGMLGEPYILTLGGRRQRPKNIKLPPVNGYRQVVPVWKDLGNSLVQGSSADLMKQAIIDAASAGLGDYLRLTVHDEMVLEVPDAKVTEAVETLERIMTRSEFVPPLTIEAAVAGRYGEAK